jgi:hypothetical protein
LLLKTIAALSVWAPQYETLDVLKSKVGEEDDAEKVRHHLANDIALTPKQSDR